VIHFLRGKNPIEKMFWLGVSIMSSAVLLGTATRGGVVSFGVACIYFLWVFRRRLNLVKCVVLISAIVVMFAAMQYVLLKYTLAVSMTDRLASTKFVGLQPESRAWLWEGALVRSRDHIFIGEGPWFDTRKGPAKGFWPHNGYLFYLCTLGLFGLSVFVIIMYRLFRISVRYAHPLASGSYLGVALSIFSAQLVEFLVGQMRTDYQRTGDYVYPYLAWMLFGLIAAAGNILKKRELEAGASAPGPALPWRALPGTDGQTGGGAFGGEARPREPGDGGSPVRRSPA